MAALQVTAKKKTKEVVEKTRQSGDTFGIAKKKRCCQKDETVIDQTEPICDRKWEIVTFFSF